MKYLYSYYSFMSPTVTDVIALNFHSRNLCGVFHDHDELLYVVAKRTMCVPLAHMVILHPPKKSSLSECQI